MHPSLFFFLYLIAEYFSSSIANIQESIDSRSEYGDEATSASAFSAVSNLDNFDLNTLGDISPDAL